MNKHYNVVIIVAEIISIAAIFIYKAGRHDLWLMKQESIRKAERLEAERDRTTSDAS